MKLLAVGAAAAVLLAPGAAVVGVATLVSPAAAGSGSCLFEGVGTGSLGVTGDVPSSLSAVNANGETVTLSNQQLQRAATIIAVGASDSIPARGQLIAVMAALTESSLRVLSNTGAYPESADIPNDGDGGDHDSLGLFQMRPSTGWGTVANLMDPVWSSRAFYGGPSGPNHGSPRGLLDYPDWAIDGARRRCPGRRGLGLSGPVRRQPAHRGEDPGHAQRRDPQRRLGVRRSGRRRTAQPAARLPRSAHRRCCVADRDAVRVGRRRLLRPDGRRLRLLRPGPLRGVPSLRRTIRLPHYSGDQIHAGQGIAWADKQPGDLIFFSYPGAGGPHHVAIYVGGEQILQAPHTGDHVRYGTISEFAGEVMTVRRLG